jgi:hypothetical protein
MGSGRAKISIAIAILAFSLSACDQIGSRYELSKDSKGRTLRLDKRTGEMVVIDGDKIVLLRDAKEEERKEMEAVERAGIFKYWPSMQLPNFKAEVKLTTVWRDGDVLYAVDFSPSKEGKGKSEASSSSDKKSGPLAKDDSAAIILAIQRHTFSLLLLDTPFELARVELKFSQVVDDQNKPIGLRANGRIKMSRESYQKVDVWNVLWR